VTSEKAGPTFGPTLSDRLLLHDRCKSDCYMAQPQATHSQTSHVHTSPLQFGQLQTPQAQPAFVAWPTAQQELAEGLPELAKAQPARLIAVAIGSARIEKRFMVSSLPENG
jgi:hypothetical protein